MFYAGAGVASHCDDVSADDVDSRDFPGSVPSESQIPRVHLIHVRSGHKFGADLSLNTHSSVRDQAGPTLLLDHGPDHGLLHAHRCSEPYPTPLAPDARQNAEVGSVPDPQYPSAVLPLSRQLPQQSGPLLLVLAD